MSREAPGLKTYNDYTVAVVFAMGFEMSAFRYMLDAEHPPLPAKPGDPNLYVVGNVHGHDIVLACLAGQQGKGAAATVATNMSRTFPRIELRFFVGIGGGVPSNRHDIRLGDVVISMPEGRHGGVVQYDLGRDGDAGFELKGFLWPPPTQLRSAVERMRSDHLVQTPKIDEYVSIMVQRSHRLATYARPSTPDVLYSNHDPSQEVPRSTRPFQEPAIHYGLIASGDRVIKSAIVRDSMVGRLGDVLCFEMEAAGMLSETPAIVIRGVSDYADAHKNDDWHGFAAATAAA